MGTQVLTVSVKEASETLGVGEHSVRSAIRTGRLRALRVGSKPRLRVPVEALHEVLSDPMAFAGEGDKEGTG